MSNNIYIIWEHFKSNYINQQSIEDDDDELDEDFEPDEPEEGEPDFGNLIRLSKVFTNPEANAHYTPWGAFHPNNPLSPVNMYDLYFAHFHGFTTFSLKNFKDLMNRTEGVAIWAQHDPYCIIMGPAKTYSATEVKYNVTSVLLSALGVSVPNSNQENEAVKSKSELMYKNGISNIHIRFPNGTIDVLENPTQIDMKDALELKTKIKDVAIFMNGESL